MTLSFVLYFFKRSTLAMLLLLSISSSAQKAYFIDGYHGGVYGHYPKNYTRFIVDKLNENPFWKINLEIEPETWDSAMVREPAALKAFQHMIADPAFSNRIEFVSPAYGQSYFFNISGESIIRHFSYGIDKVREYFPTARFTTYSSEEPCFTSALPQILTSFGFQHASLKNPNTCWGGYTRAFGGELVNWIGPDGTAITTVPRYEVEGLLPNSTWQTEAWTNSPEYIKAALDYGIKHPVAMTLQDAGWKNGPWLGNGKSGYQPTEYITWRKYFTTVSTFPASKDWHLSQEDIQVSLVWGSQVMQRIAQQVRTAENAIVMAEKMAALANVYNNKPWPKTSIDEAWRNLMLSQHHDCWIVPYNGKPGNTWADKVNVWTGATNRISDSIISNGFSAGRKSSLDASTRLRVYNTTGTNRNEYVQFIVPTGLNAKEISVRDEKGKEVIVQPVLSSQQATLYFNADVPPLGYSTYTITQKKPATVTGARATVANNGDIVLETDMYRIVLDKQRGGIISSLIAKKLKNKEFVDRDSERGFNELSGNFFNEGGFYSSAANPVQLTILEQGPVLVKAEIKGLICNDHPYTQTITLKQGDRKIDCALSIDWKSNIGIGDDYKQKGGLDSRDYRKPFYDDSQKLMAMFPVNFSTEKIYKDAPFDVTESKLSNTFFRTWDSIKNNIILNWVDVYDERNDLGFALFSDHTTTYAHGENFPLALNIQYSGTGLWGRNHSITGPTEIRYSFLPHEGKWDEGNIVTEAVNWNEPLIASLINDDFSGRKSLVDVSGTGFQVTTALMDGKDLLIRLFNADGENIPRNVLLGGTASSIELIELNGSIKEKLNTKSQKDHSTVSLKMPRYGVRTLRIKDFKPF